MDIRDDILNLDYYFLTGFATFFTHRVFLILYLSDRSAD